MHAQFPLKGLHIQTSSDELEVLDNIIPAVFVVCLGQLMTLWSGNHHRSLLLSYVLLSCTSCKAANSMSVRARKS